MGLSTVLMTAIQKMEISKPTPIQSQAIPLGLAGRDLIAIAPTGSGKTLAFALPVLMHLEKNKDARALVLAPSREMAQQIHKIFEQLSAEMAASVALVIGGIKGDKQENKLKKHPRVIIATPGRLNDHLNKNKLLLQGVEIVVIDEADRMLDMGFAPQLKNIQHTMRGPRQHLMFSATFSKKVEEIARLFMRKDVQMIRTEDAEAPVEKLKQTVLYLDRDMKNDRLVDELNAVEGSAIVFVGNQERCEEVGAYLESYGFESDFIHGEVTQGQRNRVLRQFREGQLRIVVATDLLARGIDVPHVACVISYDLPYAAEDFLHRIGRTARAGRGGQAITMVTPSDLKTFQKLEQYLEGAKEVKVDPDFNFIIRTPKGERKDAKHSKRGPVKSGKPRNDKWAQKRKPAAEGARPSRHR